MVCAVSSSLFRLMPLCGVLTLVCSSCLPRRGELEERGETEQEAEPALDPPVEEPRPASKPSPVRNAAQPDPLLQGTFADQFQRAALGDEWRTAGRGWQIEAGQLCGQRARNRPVWLKRRLPVNARIEFDAVSHSPDGDIKAEFWGDGASGATAVSYSNATSYLTIFGGWKNRHHVLARIDEHGKDRKQIDVVPDEDDLPASGVEPKQTYHFKIERRDGRTVRWWIDGTEMLSFDDERPLSGEGHDHFGFNNWEARVCFDNLEVTAL